MFAFNYKILTFFSPGALISSRNPQIQVLSGKSLFFSIKSFLLTLLSSKNFGLILFENQLLSVSIVNFNSTEKSSVREVAFSRTKTALAVSLSRKNVVLSKKQRALD